MTRRRRIQRIGTRALGLALAALVLTGPRAAGLSAANSRLISESNSSRPGARHSNGSSGIAKDTWTGRWVTKGRFTDPVAPAHISYVAEAVFIFTVDPRGLVSGEGSASITWTPGKAKQCVFTKDPAFGTIQIRVAGVRKGNELQYFTISATSQFLSSDVLICGGQRIVAGAGTTAIIGSREKSGITIPVKDGAAADQHETFSDRSTWELDHHVELCAPGNDRCSASQAPGAGSGPEKKPAKPPDDCDPNAWSDYYRKWQTAQELFARSQQAVHDATAEYEKWALEEAKTMVEISGEKTGLIKAVELVLEEGGKLVLHKVLFLVGLITTEEWLRTDVNPHFRDYNQAMRDAAKMADAATNVADSAVRDLERTFAQDQSCKEGRARAIEHEKLLDAARKLRDQWALEGSVLYHDPADPNPYPMDAAAALKRAIDILESGAERVNTKPRATKADPNRPITLTVENGRAALTQIDSALQAMAAGRAAMQKRHDFEGRWGAKLNEIIARERRAAASR